MPHSKHGHGSTQCPPQGRPPPRRPPLAQRIAPRTMRSSKSARSCRPTKHSSAHCGSTWPDGSMSLIAGARQPRGCGAAGGKGCSQKRCSHEWAIHAVLSAARPPLPGRRSQSFAQEQACLRGGHKSTCGGTQVEPSAPASPRRSLSIADPGTRHRLRPVQNDGCSILRGGGFPMGRTKD